MKMLRPSFCINELNKVNDQNKDTTLENGKKKFITQLKNGNIPKPTNVILKNEENIRTS